MTYTSKFYLFIYLFYLNHTQWYYNSREHKKYNGLEGKQ